VTFESGSHLTKIGPHAFSRCSSLSSICIPVLVECIPKICFYMCKSLSTVAFEPGAKLTRIGEEAFTGCRSLCHFTVPGQLEILEPDPFRRATSLHELTFEIPSRIRRLCLPTLCVDHLCIPDSVEFISGLFETINGRGPLLQFGRGSRLRCIVFDPYKCGPFFNSYPDPEQRIFVCLSEAILRRFRFRFDAR
jgi:hypothetical protein